MELNGDQTRTGKPNMDMEGETRARKAHGEQKHKTQGHRTDIYSPLPEGASRAVTTSNREGGGGRGALWRPLGTGLQDGKPPGRCPFRDPRRSRELRGPWQSRGVRRPWRIRQSRGPWQDRQSLEPWRASLRGLPHSLPAGLVEPRTVALISPRSACLRWPRTAGLREPRMAAWISPRTAG